MVNKVPKRYLNQATPKVTKKPPKLSQRVTTMVPKWSQMAPTWHQNDTKKGAKMNPKCEAKRTHSGDKRNTHPKLFLCMSANSRPWRNIPRRFKAIQRQFLGMLANARPVRNISQHSELFQVIPIYSWYSWECLAFLSIPRHSKAISQVIPVYACQCPAIAELVRSIRDLPNRFQSFS